MSSATQVAALALAGVNTCVLALGLFILRGLERRIERIESHLMQHPEHGH
jgi:hypothetical protein